ncbi:MAG: hypothetical protein AAF108_09650 [Planctomycetota bacterium]
MNNNYIQLILVFLVVGSGAVKWIIQRLQEQAAVKKAEQARARARAEALRTGRMEPNPEQQAAEQLSRGQPSSEQAVRDRLAELAERRRRQIEAMRRQQGPTATTAAPPQASTSSPQAPSAPIPTQSVPRPFPSPRPGRDQAPPPQQSQVADRGPRPPRRRVRTVELPAEPTPTRRVRPAPPPASSKASRRVTPAPEPEAVRSRITRPTPAELRRVIVLKEVLDPPIALRERADGSQPL